jgi:hypothetical protein
MKFQGWTLALNCWNYWQFHSWKFFLNISIIFRHICWTSNTRWHHINIIYRWLWTKNPFITNPFLYSSGSFDISDAFYSFITQLFLHFSILFILLFHRLIFGRLSNWPCVISSGFLRFIYDWDQLSFFHRLLTLVVAKAHVMLLILLFFYFYHW